MYPLVWCYPCTSPLTTRLEHAFKSSLQFEDVAEFEAHLKSRSDDIREVISQLQTVEAAKVSPEINDLQSQLAKRLAEEKVTIAKLEKTLSEKQQLEESLESASLRYMMAERKLDRAKSLTVAKLEKQHMTGSQKPSSEGEVKREDSAPANGGTPVGERANELEETNSRLSVQSERLKEQVQKLETENLNLQNQITESKIKVCSLCVSN